MAFSQSGISGVNARLDGPEFFITWNSVTPQGTIFQVYVNNRLAWYGFARQCYVPIPSGTSGCNVWVDVGTVDADEAQLDFSSILLSLANGGPSTQLTWTGGTYLDSSSLDDVQGFRLYQSTSAGAPIDWSTPLDVIPAYPGGWICDGFGLGGFGLGGFGRSASTYTWTRRGQSSGVWQFAVVPFDHEGNNRGTGQSVSVSVKAGPLPPARSAISSRLSYTYSGTVTRQITLNWLPSPS